jgi:hypothetical protein
MTVINTSPPFSSLYPTDVTFENHLVNIEILGTLEGPGGNSLCSGNPTNCTYAVVLNEYDVSSVVI